MTQPSVASQRPTPHGPGTGQVVLPPPTHPPDVHRSPVVQALPSLQAEPSAAAGNAHMPLLHVFVVHELLSLHWLDVVQEAQPAMGVVVQPLDGLQESVVQLLPSLQVSGAPAAQVPA